MRLLIAAFSLAFLAPLGAHAAPKKPSSKGKASKHGTKKHVPPPIQANCSAHRPLLQELELTPAIYSGPSGVPEFSSVHLELRSEVRGWAEVLQGYVEFREPGSQGRRWRHHIQQITRAITPSDCVFNDKDGTLSLDVDVSSLVGSESFDESAGSGSMRCETRRNARPDGHLYPRCTLKWQAKAVTMRGRSKGVCETSQLKVPATTHTVPVTATPDAKPRQRPKLEVAGVAFDNARSPRQFGWKWSLFAQPRRPIRKQGTDVFATEASKRLWTSDMTPGCMLDDVVAAPQVTSWSPSKTMTKHTVVKPPKADAVITDLRCGWSTTANEDYFVCHISHGPLTLKLKRDPDRT